MQLQSPDQVRVGHSIASYPRKHEEAKKPLTDSSSSSSISTSTSKSVSVSHVRYQVSRNQPRKDQRLMKFRATKTAAFWKTDFCNGEIFIAILFLFTIAVVVIRNMSSRLICFVVRSVRYFTDTWLWFAK